MIVTETGARTFGPVSHTRGQMPEPARPTPRDAVRHRARASPPRVGNRGSTGRCFGAYGLDRQKVFKLRSTEEYMNLRNSAASCSRGFQVFFLVLLVLLVSLGAQAQKINVGYDKSLDFSKFKTYAWEPHGAVAHPMLAADIVGAIEDEMKAKGLQLTTDKPDLVIQVYGSIDQDRARPIAVRWRIPCWLPISWGPSKMK